LPETSELAARAREGTKLHGTWSRRMRGRNGPHQREDWRRRWLDSTDFARRSPAALLRRFFSADSSGAEARQKEMGEGRRLGRAGALHLEPRRGGEGEIVGAGAGGFGTERERGRLEEMMLTSGPHLSAREREREVGWPVGPGPK
jgi:hypothetical protein